MGEPKSCAGSNELDQGSGAGLFGGYHRSRGVDPDLALSEPSSQPGSAGKAEGRFYLAHYSLAWSAGCFARFGHHFLLDSLWSSFSRGYDQRREPILVGRNVRKLVAEQLSSTFIFAVCSTKSIRISEILVYIFCCDGSITK